MPRIYKKKVGNSIRNIIKMEVSGCNGSTLTVLSSLVSAYVLVSTCVGAIPKTSR